MPDLRIVSDADRMAFLNASRLRKLQSERAAREAPRLYCLIMDSGAAWHMSSAGADPIRCPHDGCRLGHDAV